MTDETKPAAQQRPADSPPMGVDAHARGAVRPAPIGDGTSRPKSGADAEGKIAAAIRAATMTTPNDATKPARLALFERHARAGQWGRAHRALYKRICAARKKDGFACMAAPVPGRRRCKFHGGMATGPRTAEGRERCRQAALRRWARVKVARIFDD